MIPSVNLQSRQLLQKYCYNHKSAVYYYIILHCDLNIYSYSCTPLFIHLKDFTHISLTHPHNLTHSHKSIHIFIQLYTIIIHSFLLYIHFLSPTHTFTHIVSHIRLYIVTLYSKNTNSLTQSFNHSIFNFILMPYHLGCNSQINPIISISQSSYTQQTQLLQ